MPTPLNSEATLRKFALAYPEVREEFPWGERAIKVRGKVFLFMRADDDSLSLSTKLTQSKGAALMLPFAEPTHYGLGKSGWVTAKFKRRDAPPIPLLREWIDESYRAIAPKKLVAGLPPAGSITPASRPLPGSRRGRRSGGP